MRLFKFCGVLVSSFLTLGISVMCVCAAGAADANSVAAGAESEYHDAFGVLEFRIASQMASSRGRAGPLTAKQLAQYRKDLAMHGPLASIKRDGIFVWSEIMPGVKMPPNVITTEHQGSQYLLVYNSPPFVMWSGTGWGLLSVNKGAADNVGKPYVGLQFDREGADLFYDLTSINISQTLAIIIEGKVVSAPNISSAIEGGAVISGDFTAEQIDEMIKVLRNDTLTASSAASAPETPSASRPLRRYLIPGLLFVLAVSMLAYFIYR